MARPKATRRKDGRNTSERDSLDFRDWIYEPALVPLAEYLLPRKGWLHLLDQGEEGACTGFGLAAVINYQLRERGGSAGERVSPWMLYAMAKRHDRWPGHRYDGSTARGAIKGWVKNGVCHESFWGQGLVDPGELDEAGRESALQYPAGAYYRIMPRRSDVHAALVETGCVFATAATHRGWDVVEEGWIPFDRSWSQQGGHAFAIVGYTHEGFLIQNSWDEDWGGVAFDRSWYPGCAIWQYPDFDAHVWDLWVARLARPVESIEALVARSEKRTRAGAGSRPRRAAPPRAAIRDHYVHIDDGQFDPYGDFWSSEGEARRMLRAAVAGGAKHLLLYAHGGLNSVKDAARRAEAWKEVLDANGIHALHFIWETGLGEELRDVLLGKEEFVQQRAGGLSDWTDRWIERITGPLGRGLWHEMLSDAAIAFAEKGAGTAVLESLAAELAALPAARRPALHLVGHSAGSVLFGHLLSRWRALPAAAGFRFESCVLFAAACTHAFFGQHYLPALRAGTLKGLHQLLLDDAREREDAVAQIYRKSVLYLVSRSYQERGRVVPLLGLEKFLKALETPGLAGRIHHHLPSDSAPWTATRKHTEFDSDLLTMNSTLEVVLGRRPRRPFRAGELEGYE